MGINNWYKKTADEDMKAEQFIYNSKEFKHQEYKTYNSIRLAHVSSGKYLKFLIQILLKSNINIFNTDLRALYDFTVQHYKEIETLGDKLYWLEDTMNSLEKDPGACGQDMFENARDRVKDIITQLKEISDKVSLLHTDEIIDYQLELDDDKDVDNQVNKTKERWLKGLYEWSGVLQNAEYLMTQEQLVNLKDFIKNDFNFLKKNQYIIGEGTERVRWELGL